MLNDRSARSITQITLSYTFYPVKQKQAQTVDSKTKPWLAQTRASLVKTISRRPFPGLPGGNN